MTFPKTMAKPHIGRKIERLRELKDMKQETLANAIGVTQQTISRLEQSESVDEEKLRKIAEALEVTVDTIKNFNEEAAINNLSSNHTFNDQSSLNNNTYCSFNPIEKLMAIMEENKLLYERLLKEKDAVIEIFKQQQKAS
jgi:transcriptional regulator with XRE-family HTH domain